MRDAESAPNVVEALLAVDAEVRQLVRTGAAFGSVAYLAAVSPADLVWPRVVGRAIWRRAAAGDSKGAPHSRTIVYNLPAPGEHAGTRSGSGAIT